MDDKIKITLPDGTEFVMSIYQLIHHDYFAGEPPVTELRLINQLTDYETQQLKDFWYKVKQ